MQEPEIFSNAPFASPNGSENPDNFSQHCCVLTGNLGPTSTDFEEPCKKSARNLGIDHSSPEKAAREADCCAPFLYIREVRAECISLETTTSPQEKTGEIGSRDALDLPVHWLASRLFSAQRSEHETKDVAVNLHRSSAVKLLLRLIHFERTSRFQTFAPISYILP
jgi:hypothetical protein